MCAASQRWAQSGRLCSAGGLRKSEQGELGWGWLGYSTDLFSEAQQGSWAVSVVCVLLVYRVCGSWRRLSGPLTGETRQFSSCCDNSGGSIEAPAHSGSSSKLLLAPRVTGCGLWSSTVLSTLGRLGGAEGPGGNTMGWN